ncbi:TetR/AcrR family transcriptional regulator [Acinetobacter sp. MD2]|uniref:TetR/AcrR family transcriptional regulator n=1 Tax=Acinetobacter sp. MD2 TaxID=2600066 RepID=UPI002D1E6195|nr:TetR family transcriptional regulator [Acinetobacter sp. MD2]MEB3767369.1 TetR family transcriptional regulator [Acinetobacter sp. MD2]
MSIRAERKLQSQHAILETVLSLNYAGQNFSSMSLRQLARDVGIVPSALYRYFQNKEALAAALIDHVAFVIKSDLNLMINCCNETPSNTAIDRFFQQASQHARYWHFFIAERWGGFTVLQEKIEQEITDLTDNFAQRLMRKMTFPTQQTPHTLAAVLIPLFFTWIMQWLTCQKKVMSEIAQKNYLDQVKSQLILLIAVTEG